MVGKRDRSEQDERERDVRPPRRPRHDDTRSLGDDEKAFFDAEAARHQREFEARVQAVIRPDASSRASAPREPVDRHATEDEEMALAAPHVAAQADHRQREFDTRYRDVFGSDTPSQASRSSEPYRIALPDRSIQYDGERSDWSRNYETTSHTSRSTYDGTSAARHGMDPGLHEGWDRDAASAGQHEVFLQEKAAFEAYMRSEVASEASRGAPSTANRDSSRQLPPRPPLDSVGPPLVAASSVETIAGGVQMPPDPRLTWNSPVSQAPVAGAVSSPFVGHVENYLNTQVMNSPTFDFSKKSK